MEKVSGMPAMVRNAGIASSERAQSMSATMRIIR
jgi:hypothetical protein